MGRTRWGYHQLSDRHASALVTHAGVRAHDLVIDVGAGDGRITRHLVAAGAHVVAVELHPGRAARLRTAFWRDGVQVLELDLDDWLPPRRPFRVVANPPFGRLATLLRRLTAADSRLLQADLVVPDYVAARWSRGAGYRPNAYSAARICRLPDSAFTPPATQPTAVLRIARRPAHSQRSPPR